MQKTILKIVKFLAQKIIAKYKPKVIGITGSIGKTSTKDAIFTVLSGKFPNVRRSMKNYNNEIGVPLTIIGCESPGKSVLGWLGVFGKGLKVWLFGTVNYPEILVLEMAADKPGDIKYLLEIAPCAIGVLTKIAPVHLEQFKTLEKIAREKRQIISHLGKNGIAILNNDDQMVMAQKDMTKVEIITYGFAENSDVRAIELETSGKGLDVDGIQFKMVYKGSAVPVFLPKVIGKNSILAALAAAAVGISMDMNLVEISEFLKNYVSPKGRMNLIDGIKHTLIIDDTYNASPESTEAALEVLNKFEIEKTAKRIAVLGNMLELGSVTEKAHEDAGRLAANLKIDLLITVGEFGLLIAKSAVANGMAEEKVFSFDYAQDAGRFLQDRMKKGDIVLVKGSQGSRMEKVVKEVMAEPLRARELLVRQEKEWEKK